MSEIPDAASIIASVPPVGDRYRQVMLEAQIAGAGHEACTGFTKGLETYDRGTTTTGPLRPAFLNAGAAAIHQNAPLIAQWAAVMSQVASTSDDEQIRAEAYTRAQDLNTLAVVATNTLAGVVAAGY